ncbi:pentapeptide repeat-containing protein [Brachyspira alvinipulli]|uniref:pentapeptide repeat-containing protein n=1 Tax=Brachyspira alvinipulli TaxID=84379 RepID=UPI003005B3AD
MTILNVDEIEKYDIENLNPDGIDKYGLTKQPTIYNSSEELIKWLKYDLLQQALRRNKKPDENNIITITDEEEKDYILNIGREVWDINYYINIYFDFSLYDLQVLLYGNSDNIRDNYRINTDYIIFHKEADFYSSKNYYRFRGVTFYKKVSFYENKFIEEIKFDNVIFYKEVDFLGAYFYKKVSFSGTYFHDYVCLSSSFYDEVSFYGITIKKEMYFGTHNEKINTVIFSDIIFENQKSMLYIGNINKVNNFSFVHTAINGQVELNDIEINEADFKGSVINGGYINPVNFKVHKFANRESALFLKQQAYARNNAIDALEYKAKEIECHKNDLIKDWKKDKNLKTLGDILSIELSSLYSDNGQNWIRALLVTILLSISFFTFSYNLFNIFIFILCFLLSLISKIFIKSMSQIFLISIITYFIYSFFTQYMIFNKFKLFIESNYIENILQFLTPTNFEQINFTGNNNSYIYHYKNDLFKFMSGLFYFLGKIAFWYGSVQTVQAFRKFAKGA